jgi:hypothetical protein
MSLSARTRAPTTVTRDPTAGVLSRLGSPSLTMSAPKRPTRAKCTSCTCVEPLRRTYETTPVARAQRARSCLSWRGSCRKHGADHAGAVPGTSLAPLYVSSFVQAVARAARVAAIAAPLPKTSSRRRCLVARWPARPMVVAAICRGYGTGGSGATPRFGRFSCVCVPFRAATNPLAGAARRENSPFASCGQAAGGGYPRPRGRGRGVLPAAAGSRPGMPPLPRARVPAAGSFRHRSVPHGPTREWRPAIRRRTAAVRRTVRRSVGRAIGRRAPAPRTVDSTCRQRVPPRPPGPPRSARTSPFRTRTRTGIPRTSARCKLRRWAGRACELDPHPPAYRATPLGSRASGRGTRSSGQWRGNLPRARPCMYSPAPSARQ